MLCRTTAILACEFRTVGDLDVSKLEAFLAKLGKKAANKTRNERLLLMKAFTRWMADYGRLERMPFGRIKRLSEKQPSKSRRPMTKEEFQKLVQTTYASTKRRLCLTGKERALIYMTAALTGLRRKELAALKVKYLLAATDEIYIPGTLQKGDKTGVEIAVPQALMADLLKHAKGKKADDPIFNMKSKGGVLRVITVALKRDCEAAGVDYYDAKGHACDFHAFRKKFIVDVCRTCDDFGAAFKASRHAHPKTMLGTYDSVNSDAKRKAIAGLDIPSLAVEA